MPRSLKNKFAGMEAETVKAVREFGIDSTMALYGVKHRKTFLAWLRDNTGEEWKPSPMAEIKGGNRRKWVNEHRLTILDCLEIFGEDWVKANFHFTHDTLEGVIQGNGDKPPLGYDKKLTRLERVEFNAREALNAIRALNDRLEKIPLQLALKDERWKEISKQNEEIRQACTDFAEITAKRVAQALLLPLLQQVMPVLQNLVPTDERLKPQTPDLSIASLLAQGEKCQVEATPENPLLQTVARTKALTKKEN